VAGPRRSQRRAGRDLAPPGRAKPVPRLLGSTRPHGQPDVQGDLRWRNLSRTSEDEEGRGRIGDYEVGWNRILSANDKKLAKSTYPK